jgi:hypothetical protein
MSEFCVILIVNCVWVAFVKRRLCLRSHWYLHHHVFFLTDKANLLPSYQITTRVPKSQNNSTGALYSIVVYRSKSISMILPYTTIRIKPLTQWTKVVNPVDCAIYIFTLWPGSILCLPPKTSWIFCSIDSSTVATVISKLA